METLVYGPVRIALVIAVDNLARHAFRMGGANPGVGGTPFTVIQLALRLAGARPSWDVTLVNTAPVAITDGPANLHVELSETAAAFFSRTHPERFAVIVAPVETLRRVDPALLRTFRSTLVAWSRHPFDPDLRRLDMTSGFAAAISVGRYQFHSNAWLRSPAGFIQNIFYPPRIADSPVRCPGPGDPIHLVHLGALVAGKGFDRVAQAWPVIRDRWPRARLHVIGSGALYRDRPLHARIPATPDAAERILRAIPIADIDAGRVVFHGALGEGKGAVLSQAHIAVQNPTGASEAFPASTLDCMAAGLPVVASADYGMWDSMHHFPELQVRDSSQIVDRITWLLADPARFTAVSTRALEVARRCRAQTDQIVRQWITLLEALADGTAVTAALPRPPRPRHALHFAWRIAHRHWRIFLAHTPAGAAWRRIRTLRGVRPG